MPPRTRTPARTARTARTDTETPAAAPAATRPRATRSRKPADAATKPAPKRARRSAGITVADDAEKFAAPAPAAPEPAAATAAPAAGATARMPAGRKPWERELDERRTAISVRLPESLKARLDGLHDYLQLTDPEKLPALLRDCTNQTDLFNHALHRLLTAAEDESNGGKPFPVKIRRGR